MNDVVFNDTVEGRESRIMIRFMQFQCQIGSKTMQYDNLFYGLPDYDELGNKFLLVHR